MSQRNRQDYDSTSIKICHMPPSSVESIQRMRSQKLDIDYCRGYVNVYRRKQCMP